MLPSLLARSATRSAVLTTQRRNMAGGGFPYKMSAKKNKFVEEWNGRREITEQAFVADAKKTRQILWFGVAIPYFIYWVSRHEFEVRGDPKYKDMI